MMNKDEVRQHLTNDLIPFWCALKDQEHGGFYGYMDEEGVIDKEAEKGCILNNRILWFFSNAAMVLQDRSLIDYAGHAFRFLRDHAWDNEQGVNVIDGFALSEKMCIMRQSASDRSGRSLRGLCREASCDPGTLVFKMRETFAG